MNSDINRNELMRIFKSRDVAAQQAFIDKCPPSPFRETASLMAGLGRPESGIMALDILAMDYARGINCKLGAEIAKVCHKLACGAFKIQGPGPADVYLLYAGRSANSYVTALQRLGRHKELLAFTKKAITWLEQAGDTAHLPFLRLCRIEANIDLMNYDQAKELLSQAKDLQFTPADRMQLHGMERRLNDIMQKATKIPPRKPVEAVLAKKRRQILEDALKVITDISPRVLSTFESKEIIDTLKKRLAAESEMPKYTEENFKSISKALDVVTDFLTKGGGELNEWEIMKRIRNATSIFRDPVKGRNPEAIKKSLAVLKQARDWAKVNNFPQHENDALWGLYLCYNRTERESQAVEVLQSLRANVEEARGRISDPHERAGVMTKYPYLFPALCQLLCRLKRPAELLDAMEGAKGRVLADVLSQRQSRPVMERIFSEPTHKLPSLMQRLDAHYLSYLVDDEETYAVLVARNGSFHSHSIPLGKTTLRGWVEEINPINWGKKDPTDAFSGKRLPSDLPDRLAPLVDWLEPFAESGLLRKDDHICYSPDEQLHLIPLHYVSFRGEPLVRYVSLSRIHGARALTTLLEEENEPLKKFTAIQVPAQQDLKESERNAEKLVAFRLASDWLRDRLPGEVARGEQVDLEAVARLHLRKRIVHFATHGTFPHEGIRHPEPNPYKGSGLVIGQTGQLPDLSRIWQGEAEDSLLTPKKVLDLGLDFSGSHVTMQACVSGLSKEGIGGDALGLEWALLQAGANSLLATHWDVNAQTSADFSLGFYQRWLFDKASRAVAWRKTVLELMDSQEVFEHHRAYYWAPFSLSGDWR